MMGWIGVDLDGTLAKYGTNQMVRGIGEPIEPIVALIKKWLGEGLEVKIFTARASVPELVPPVQDWLEKIRLPRLEVTNVKDFGMLLLLDDRAISVEYNTGRILTEGWTG